MDTSLIVLLVIAFIVVDMILVVAFVRWRKRGGKPPEHMTWLSEQLGIPVTGGTPLVPSVPLLSFLRNPYRLDGERHGCSLHVYHYTSGSGNSRTTYTAVQADAANGRGLTFRFSKEGILTKLGHSLGLKDVSTGDPRFDDLFKVKCNDPDFIAQALLPQVKEKFCAVWGQHRASGTIEANADGVRYHERGTIRNAEARARIAAVADLACDLAGIVRFYNR